MPSLESWSPCVRMTTVSTGRPEARVSSAAKAPDWVRASALARVPIRSGRAGRRRHFAPLVEAEKGAHGRGALEALRAVAFLQAHRRVVEDVGDERLREPLDRGPVGRAQRGELAGVLLELGAPDALELLAQAAHDVGLQEAAAPLLELQDALLDDRLRARDLARARPRVHVRHLLQRVEVVAVDVGELADLGLDVARHGEVEDEERAAARRARAARCGAPRP